MKFGADLKANLTSEWRNQYIDYEALKAIITPYEGIAGEMHLVDESKKHTVTGARPSSIKDRSSRLETSTRKSKAVSGIKGLGMQMMITQMSAAGMIKQFDLCSQKFFIALDKELEKINLFFAENISAATRSYLEIEGMTHFKYDSYSMTVIKHRGICIETRKRSLPN